MLNNQPTGNQWHLLDNDAESQHYGRTFHFDFSYIPSEEMKSVVKNYVWQNWRTGSKRLSSLLQQVVSFRYFANFATQHGIYSFSELDASKIDLFLSFLRTETTLRSQKPMSYKYQKSCFDSLKAVVAWCRIHYPELIPSTEFFTGNEFPGVNRRLKVEFIPDEIMAQINIALKTEDNPYLKYGIIILESTGMRIGELLSLRIDCIKPHFVSGYMISWFDFKNRRERPAMPVANECAHAIKKMIDITTNLRKEAEGEIKNLLFLYNPSSNNQYVKNKVVVPKRETFNRWLKKFAADHNIIDNDGSVFNITAHQFRRTLGTDMLSKGTDITVIQQVLGHSTPSVTKQFYADIKDRDRAETFKNIGIVGNVDLIADSAFESSSEKEWFLLNKHKSAALCDGYCTKPVVDGQVCERLLKRQKCYTCSRYVTTPEYLETHKRHLVSLERQLEEGAIYGEHYAEHFLPTIKVLKEIIERLEELNNGRTKSGLTTTAR